MNAIVAVDSNWGIGKDNDLLCYLPQDLQYYKSKTINKCIIVGRKTLESFPGGKPLPKRDIIVLTSDKNYKVTLRDTMKMAGEAGDQPYTCTLCSSKEEVLEVAARYQAANPDDEDAVMVCGGASIYEMFADDCDAFYVTKINQSFDADRFFPNLDGMGLKITWESDLQEENGINYTWTKYERV